MNILTAVLFVLIGCALAVTVYFVSDNRSRSLTNRELIEGNKQIIKQNQTLIALINAMISSSDIKVRWDEYAKVAATYGVKVHDPQRDLDITDPEG